MSKQVRKLQVLMLFFTDSMNPPTPETGWIKLGRIQPKHTYFSIIYDSENNSLFMVNKQKHLFCCSFTRNKWVKHKIISSANVNSDFGNISCNATAINFKQKKIYIHHDEDSIAIYSLTDTNSTKLEIIDDILGIGDGMGSKAVIIDNNLHLIGADGDKHMTCDPISKNVQVLHDLSTIFKDLIGFRGVLRADHRIVQISNTILLFGGCDSHDNHCDDIYEYDIIGNHWKELKCKIPNSSNEFGCTSILNGQYVVLFGGFNYSLKDEISVFSVQNREFNKAKIKCPEKGTYQAITFNDRIIDDLITFGYLRSRWITSGMDNHLFPPQYLIKIIYGYYWNEWVHLFDMSTCDHYKIDVTVLFD